jgi:hypothetical protein
MLKSVERLVQGYDIADRNHLPQPLFVFFKFNALHSVLDYEFYFILWTTRTTSVFFVAVWQTAILVSVG